MHEVSCRVLSIFFKPFAARGIPLTELVAGTPVTLATLKDKNQRVDWSDLCVMMDNVRRHFDEPELVEIGRQYFRAPAMRFLFVVARMLFTPMEFIRWTNKPVRGNQLAGVLLWKGKLSREQFVEHNSQGIGIRSGGRKSGSPERFGRKISQGAAQVCRTRCSSPAARQT